MVPPTATAAYPETTMKMAAYILATNVIRSCAMALGKAISSKTSTRPFAIKTCPSSMQRPGWLPNGSGITALLTRSTLFADSESKKRTHMLHPSCLTLSMRKTFLKMSTHLRLTHISLKLQLPIYITHTRPVIMVLRNSLLKVMRNSKAHAHASANMPIDTNSRTFLHSSLVATTQTVTQAI